MLNNVFYFLREYHHRVLLSLADRPLQMFVLLSAHIYSGTKNNFLSYFLSFTIMSKVFDVCASMHYAVQAVAMCSCATNLLASYTAHTMKSMFHETNH